MNKLALCFGVALIAVAAAWPARVARQAVTVEEQLGLPSNATAIRPNIVDTFTCADRIYGYYADVANECQIFHVCLPLQFPDGRSEIAKWSFICPLETIFNQESMTCARPEDAVPCEEAPKLYNLNENFGKTTAKPLVS